MIDITPSLSQEQILSLAHKATAIPSLVIFYILFSLVFLGTGLLLIDSKKSGYGKFLLIWGVSVFAGGLIVLWLSLSPSTVQWIMNIFI